MTVNAGAEIRRLRIAAGLSLGELAQRTRYDKGYLSKIESGIKPLNATMARLVDIVLDAGGQIVALVSDAGDAPSNTELGIYTVGTDDLPTHLGTISGEALWAAAHSGTVADSLWALLGRIRDLGRSVSPRLVLDLLTTQTRAVDLLATAAPASSPAAQRLFHLASRFAEYTGWMFQESDDIKTARSWTAYAGRLAASGDQPDTVQFCRIRAADLALGEYRLTEAVELASQIQRAPLVSNHVRALAALVQARGHALAGEARACDAALDRAHGLAHTDDGPVAAPVVLGFTGSPDPVAATRGWAWHDLGHVAKATVALRTALDQAAPTSVRTRTRLAVRTALAHADAGDLRTARDLIQDVLAEVQAVDSAPIRADVRQLLKTINRSRSAEFSELRQQLKTAVSSGRPA
jgi:hypothetical protein